MTRDKLSMDQVHWAEGAKTRHSGNTVHIGKSQVSMKTMSSRSAKAMYSETLYQNSPKHTHKQKDTRQRSKPEKHRGWKDIKEPGEHSQRKSF